MNRLDYILQLMEEDHRSLEKEEKVGPSPREEELRLQVVMATTQLEEVRRYLDSISHVFFRCATKLCSS